MSRLTAADRRNLKPSQFAGPHGSFPVPDRPHAVDAKARASAMRNEGLMSAAEQSRIDTAANRVLKRTR